MRKFNGRAKEKELVNSFLTLKEIKKLLILGREKVGKTALVINSIKNRNDCLYYIYRKINLDELSNINSSITTLILDDTADINKAMEIYKSIASSRLKLIIITSILDADKSLFDEVIELHEQKYAEACLYYYNYNDKDKDLLYKILGGEPLLNSKIDNSLTALENIYKLAISSDSYLELYVNLIFNTELHKSIPALNVLISLASLNDRLTTIATSSSISTQLALTILNKLIKLGYVERLCDGKDMNNKKRTSYRLISNCLSFYFKYIYSNLSMRALLSEEEFYTQYIKPEIGD